MKKLFKAIAILLAVLSFTGCAKQPKPVIPVELFEVTYVACADHDGFSNKLYYNVVFQDEAETLGNFAYNNIDSLNSVLELSEFSKGLIITFNALDVSEIIVNHKDDALYSDVIVTAENIISRAYGRN